MEQETKHDELKAALGWYACPNILDLTTTLSVYEKVVWHNFAAHCNSKTGACYPSRETQAKEIGINKETVSKARTGLIEKGWLKKEPVTDAKTNLIKRYNWELLVPETPRSALLPADRKKGPGRRQYRLTDKSATNNTNSKQHIVSSTNEVSDNTKLVPLSEGVADAPLTPAEEMRLFVSDEAKREQIIAAMVGKGIDEKFARVELQKFFIHWTERNKSGTKQRWELEKTFEIRRRLVTWLNNAPKFNGWRGNRAPQSKGKSYD